MQSNLFSALTRYATDSFLYREVKLTYEVNSVHEPLYKRRIHSYPRKPIGQMRHTALPSIHLQIPDQVSAMIYNIWGCNCMRRNVCNLTIYCATIGERITWILRSLRKAYIENFLPNSHFQSSRHAQRPAQEHFEKWFECTYANRK